MKAFIKKIPWWLPLLLVGMLIGKNARAQDTLPYVPIPTDSAVWYVFEGARYFKNVPNGNEPGGPPVRILGPFLYGQTARYIIYGDTLAANGKRYDKLNRIDDTSNYNKYFLRQDSVERRVFLRGGLREDDKEFILYEFNKAIGDTVHGISLANYLGIRSVVDSVKYLTIDGVQHKALYLRNINSPSQRFFDVWIEGIGSIYGLLNSYSAQNLMWPGPFDSELQCLQTRNGTLYTGEYVSLCGDTLITGIEEAITQRNWGIAPNPVEDRITQANWPVREDQIINFELIDANGRSLGVQKTFSSEWITSLTPGVYCLRLNIKNEIPFIQRFIKL